MRQMWDMAPALPRMLEGASAERKGAGPLSRESGGVIGVRESSPALLWLPFGAALVGSDIGGAAIQGIVECHQWIPSCIRFLSVFAACVLSWLLR